MAQPVAKQDERTLIGVSGAPSALGLLKSYERHLRALRKSDATLHLYRVACLDFIQFSRDQGMPDIENVHREHIETWMVHLHERLRPHSVRSYFVALRLFIRWLRDEGELSRDPTERIGMPVLDETRKDIASSESITAALKRLEKARNWRDAAIVSILYDTGLRASELAGARTEHLNLDTGLLFIAKSKSHRARYVHLSPETIQRIDRYLRRRPTDAPGSERVVSGPKGPLTRSGLYRIVREAFAAVGVVAIISPHDLRHTSASAVAGSMSEADMNSLFGWSDPEMARHYTAQVRERLALAAHAKHSPMDALKPRGKS